MSFYHKHNLKIKTYSLEQEEAVHTLVEQGFSASNKPMEFSNGLCKVFLESSTGFEATVDCYGKMNGNDYQGFIGEYVAYLAGASNAQNQVS
jgi:hypothetical protein